MGILICDFGFEICDWMIDVKMALPGDGKRLGRNES